MCFDDWESLAGFEVFLWSFLKSPNPSNAIRNDARNKWAVMLQRESRRMNPDVDKLVDNDLLRRDQHMYIVINGSEHCMIFL